MIAQEVMARFQADTSGLRRGTQEVNSMMRGLSASTRTAGQSMTQSFTAAAHAQTTFQKSLVTTKSLILGIGGAMGVTAIVQRGFSAAKSAVMDFNSTLEQAQVGFTTMLGSAKSASTFLTQLQGMAAKTPFTFESLIQGSQRLMALGFAANKVQPMLTAVGDAVSALGGTMEYQGSIITRALGQMQAKGKVSAEEMMQLSEAGISAWQYLADAFNTTTADMMDRAKNTVVSSESAITAILAGMQNDFGGMMEAQSRTLQGALSNVYDITQQTIARGTLPLYERMRDAVLRLSEILQSSNFQAAAKRFGESMSSGMDRVFDSLGRIGSTIGPALQGVFDSLRGQGGSFSGIGHSIEELITALAEAAAAAIKFGAAFLEVAPPVAITALRAATTVLGLLANFMAKNEALMKTFMALFAANKILGWVRSMRMAVSATMLQAEAHITARNAALQQLSAEKALGAQLASNATTSAAARGSQSFQMANGAGITMLSGAWQANMKAQKSAMISLGQQGAAAVQQINQSFLGGAQAASKFGRALGGVQSALGALGFTPVTAGLTLVVAGFAAVQSSYAKQRESAAAWVQDVTKRFRTVEGQWRALARQIKNQPLMPSNDDLGFSGGMFSDIGTRLGNAWEQMTRGGGFQPMRFFTGLFGSDSDRTAATDAVEQEMQDLWNQLVEDQQNTYDTAIENANQFARDMAMEAAQAADQVNEELQKMFSEEIEVNMGVLNPLQNFLDQDFISFDQMKANLQDNIAALMSWRNNLTYLLSTGNTEVAAYFAELGPTAGRALAEMIAGGQPAIDDFYDMILDGYSAAGMDSATALQNGLSQIPALLEAAGIDAEEYIGGMIERTRTEELSNEIREKFRQVIEGGTQGVEALVFNTTLEAHPEMAQEDVVALAEDTAQNVQDTLNGIPTEVIWKLGITPEMLSIPDVQLLLADAVSPDSPGGEVVVEQEVEAIYNVAETRVEAGAMDTLFNADQAEITLPGLDISQIVDDAATAQDEIDSIEQGDPPVIDIDLRTHFNDSISAAREDIDSLDQDSPPALDVEIDLATGHINDIQDAIDGVVQSDEPHLDANIDDANAAIDEAQAYIDDLKQSNIPGIDAVIDPLQGVIDTATTLIDGIQQGEPPDVTVDDEATGPIGVIEDAINGLQDREITITTNHVVHNSVVYDQVPADDQFPGNVIPSDAGRHGMIFSYAVGGMTLPNRAIIEQEHGAPLIQWAEPGTGGEAFIPMGASNRNRSIDIWKEVGKRFGLIAYAAGGIQVPDSGRGTTRPAARPTPSPTPTPWPQPRTGDNAGPSSGRANTSTPRGRTAGSGGGSRGENATMTNLDLIKNMYDVGDATAETYIRYLQAAMKSQKKYSDDWTANAVQVQRLQEEIAQAEEDKQAALKEQRDAARRVQDNMHAAGAMGDAGYLKLLRQRLAGEKKFSDEWMAIWNSINQVEQARADEAKKAREEQKRRQEARAQRTEEARERRRSGQDIRYETGAMAAGKYQQILRSRLANEQKYSKDWYAIWQQLQGVTEDIKNKAKEQKDAIEQTGLSVADALMQSFDKYAKPVQDQTDIFSALGSGAVDLGQLQGFYGHTQEATGRWQASLKQLESMGLNQDFLQQLAQQGPQALEFAESLVKGGAAAVGTINAGETKLDDLATAIGKDFMDAAKQVGNTITIGDVTVDIPEDVGLSKAQIRQIIDKAMKELAAQIKENY